VLADICCCCAAVTAVVCWFREERDAKAAQQLSYMSISPQQAPGPAYPPHPMQVSCWHLAVVACCMFRVDCELSTAWHSGWKV
jgi:hypothetical protein